MDIQWIKERLEQPGKSKSGLAKFLGIPNSAVTETKGLSALQATRRGRKENHSGLHCG